MTRNKHKLTAQPGFIICHNGHDYQSGHNISLRFEDMGWILNDDHHPAQLLLEPSDYLRKKRAYPYLIDYRVIGSEPG